MTTLYEFLRAAKGKAYKPDKIKSYSWLAKKPEIDDKPGRLAGNSRVIGDASADVQNRVIDLLIEVGVRYKLSYRDIAHMLLITKVESGFNPDAAAGTTSAAGLGQYTKATVEEAAKPRISKNRLGFCLDLSGENVFDAQKGAYGMLLSYMISKERAAKKFGDDCEDNLYLFHHEGWYFGASADELATARVKDVYAIINTKIKPHIPTVEKLLNSKSSIQFQLNTSDDKAYPNQPFVAIKPRPTAHADSPALSQDSSPGFLDVIFGKTDGEGRTPIFAIKALDEVVFVILNKDYKELTSARSANGARYQIKAGETLGDIARRSGTTSEELASINGIDNPNHVRAGQVINVPGQAVYTVKPGDTLDKIATAHGTTPTDLARLNNLPDPDKLSVGQKLVLFSGSRVPRRPGRGFVAALISETLNLASFGALDAIVEHSRSHVALPMGNEAHKGSDAANVISIKGGSSAAQVGQQPKQDVPHRTNEEGDAKPVEKPRLASGKPLRDKMLFPLPVKPVQSYKTGARQFAWPRSKVRKHAGRDLYAPLGTTVRAMDDGVVLAADSFYCETDEIVVDHGGFIVRYGEVKPADKLPGKKHFVAVGDKVKRGQKIAEVGDLIGINAPCMLHVEMYSTNSSIAKTPLSNKVGPYMRRGDLVDPMDTLDAAVME